MTTINWKPSAKEMRRWALIIAPALGLVGSLFYFTEWGIFAGGQSFALFLWAFGAVAFVTGITGTKIGLPIYWLSMGFSYVMSIVIGYTALGGVFLLVVTPMAMLAKIARRDRLGLRAAETKTYWSPCRNKKDFNPQKLF